MRWGLRGLVCPERTTDALLDRDLGTPEAKSTPGTSRTVPKQTFRADQLLPSLHGPILTIVCLFLSLRRGTGFSMGTLTATHPRTQRCLMLWLICVCIYILYIFLLDFTTILFDMFTLISVFKKRGSFSSSLNGPFKNKDN